MSRKRIYYVKGSQYDFGNLERYNQSVKDRKKFHFFESQIIDYDNEQKPLE